MNKINESILDTMKHKLMVIQLVEEFCNTLKKSALTHDDSKMEPPELEIYAEYVPQLQQAEYGSKEYKEITNKMDEAIKRHYKVNPHHPQFYMNGIDDMDLADLVEMLADWMAATKRNPNGNIEKSLEICKEKFHISDQLFNILKNTLDIWR